MTTTEQINRLTCVAAEEFDENIIVFAIESVNEMIKNYCNTNEVPLGLLNTSIMMANDILQNKIIGETGCYKGVKSLKEGEMSISFSEGEKIHIVNEYKHQLNKYRKPGY